VLSVDEARATILGAVQPRGAETVPFARAAGRVLAEDLLAETPVPPFIQSAMDGFAVRAADTRDALTDHPIALRILGTVGAGHLAPWRLTAGTAVRIMTGAPIPEGADAVVRREDTEFDGDAVQIFRPASPREYVVFPGRDIPQGALLLRGGDVITAGAVGLLASLGRTQVPVFKRPRIGVLALGDELIPPEAPLQPGQIRVSNLYTIEASITRYGGEAITLGIASDRLEMIQAALERAQDADVLLTLGGSQRGDFDLVHEVLSAPRGELIFREIGVNYARSMIFGHFGRIPFFGLPGSPMTSFVAFEAFVRPALWKLAGRRILEWPRVEALLSQPLPAATARALFHPVWVEARTEGLIATPLRLEKAADLPPQALANGLIYCAAESPACPAGARVWVNLLEAVGTSQTMGG